MSATNTELAAFLRTMAEWVSSHGVWTGAEIERFYIEAEVEAAVLAQVNAKRRQFGFDPCTWHDITERERETFGNWIRAGLEAARKAKP